jgi:HK97 family phage major capsid protein
MENIDVQKENELIAKLEAKFTEATNEFKKGAINEEALVSKLKPIEHQLAKLQESYKPEELKNITTAIDVLSQKIAVIGEVKKDNPTTVDEFKEALKNAALKAKENLTTKSKSFATVEKTLSSMTFTDNVSGQIPQAQREPGITNVVRQQFTVRNGANVFGITSNLAEWVEQRNITGAAAATLEGGTKAQVEWDYFVASQKVEKITEYVKISTEMLDDIDGMMSEINGNLTYLMDLKEESYLFTGNGSSPQIKGIDAYADDIDLAALGNTIAAANNWDCIAAAITQIRVNGKGELKANRIFMNPVDIFLSLFAIKETTGGYVNPVSVIANPNPMALPSIYVLGVPVVESDSVSAGTFYVCDMTKFNIRDKQQFTIEVGFDSDDFIKNMVTIRAEKRLVTYVKANHTEGFIKDTFAGAKLFLADAS